MQTPLKRPPKRRRPPCPDAPLFVVGNIHGCAKQLGKLLAEAPGDAQIVFLGDFIDFGPQSERVLARVQKECAKGAIALMGNHERMFLDFLEDPTRNAAIWLRSGGDKTLKSYGINGISSLSSKEEFEYAANQLRVRIPRRVFRWLNQLTMQFDSGSVHVVHAAACPNTPIASQSDQVRLWGAPEFLVDQRSDHEWVVHGDVIVKSPIKKHGRINIDTGVHRTGRLSAVYIGMKGQKFMTVTG